MGKFIFTDEQTNTPYLVSKKDNEWGVEKAFPFEWIKKYSDFVYEIEYIDDLDYELAMQEYAKRKPVPPNGLMTKKKFARHPKPFACSGVRNGNFYGRNFDWIYNDDIEFIIHIGAKEGRHASLNVATRVPGLNNQIIDSNEPNDAYKLLPFTTMDGINDAGVVCNINVVPCDKGYTLGTVPTKNKEYEMCSEMLCRFILDKFDNAKDAVEYVQEHISVFMVDDLYNMNYDLHLMCADENETYLIEWANNETIITNMTPDSDSTLAGKSYMTNFFLHDCIFNADGTVYTPGTQDETHNAVDTNNITLNGDGLERYNLIVSKFANANTKDGMRDMMNSLKYSQAYSTKTEPIWCTEFVEDGVASVKTPASVYEAVIKYYEEVIYPNKTRDENSPYYGCWQTTHSSVYDIEKRKLYIICQENGKELEFTL